MPIPEYTKPAEQLIIFSRYPEPGRTKTRLIPALGADGAARLQRQMTGQCLKTAEKVATSRGLSLELRYTGGNRDMLKQCFPQRIALKNQGNGDLGKRLCRAFAQAFGEDKGRVVIIGSDCPRLSPAAIINAFEALNKKDLVLGPATDGGYYLIGLSRLIKPLFVDIPWGTGQVLSRTLGIAQKNALTYLLLEPLSDVDRPEDLRHINNNSNP